jgi:SagB-type dehydrogenase family enzyme
MFAPGELYHEASKLHPSDRGLFRTIGLVNSSPRVRGVITRPTFRGSGIEARPLPAPAGLDEASLDETLRGRRSSHAMTGTPLTYAQWAALLFAGLGTVGSTAPDTGGARFPLRTAPSAGGLTPIELVCAAWNVEDVPEGVYGYLPDEHAVAPLRSRRGLAEEIAQAMALGTAPWRAAACIVLVHVRQRSYFKYGERSYRFALLECGHVAQNILLAAAALGLPACPVGGFLDDAVNDTLGLDGLQEYALYTILISGARPPGGTQ